MLTSTQNPLVKEIKKLHTPKGRREQQKFLLEGTHLVEEACAVNYPLVTICCTPQWQNRHPQLWQDAASRSQRAELVSQDVIEAIATTVNPDGIVATAERIFPGNTNPKSTDPLLTSIGLALQTMQDPGNLGTIIRTCAAAGAQRLWLSTDSVDLDNPKVLRSSAGQWFRLPMQVSPCLLDLVTQCQTQGIQVVATVPSATLSYWDLDLRCPTLLLLGNEAAGLTDELIQKADHKVNIPLSPGVESLNVAIAAALILYEAKRQRLEKIG